MCGIMGFSGSRNYDQQAIERILICNMVRGDMATGTYSFKEHIVKKHNVDAVAFCALFPPPQEDTLFIGHTRHATQGTNIPRNAHPFKIGHIIGIHNGMITNDGMLAKEYKFKHTVDSEAIFHMIGLKGFDGLKEVHGGCAIAFVDDRKPNSLFLYRRDNPIYIGYKADAVYFSSLQYSLEKADCRDIGMLKPDIVFEFKNGHLIEQTPIEYKRPPYVPYKNWDDDLRDGKYGSAYDGLVYNLQRGVWEYPRKQIGFNQQKESKFDTLADRKQKSKEPIPIESGRTATAFSHSPEPKLKAASYDDLDEMIALLQDCLWSMEGWKIDGGEANIKRRIRKLIY